MELLKLQHPATMPEKRKRGRPRGSSHPKKEQNLTKIFFPQQKIGISEEKMTVMEEIGHAFRRGNRIAAWVGLILGGFVPLASYTLIHAEVANHHALWLLIGGGLIYSALSVYRWALEAFHYAAKAIGFVILLEGTMTFSQIRWLGLTGLVILMAINGVSAAVSLQQTQTHVDG